MARPTFDQATAAPMATAAHRRVVATGLEVRGDGVLRTDVGEVEEAVSRLGSVDALVVLQATFTDGTLHEAASREHPHVPIVLWGFPEPRTGDRLRLNSLCGINLGAFTLGGRDVRWLYLLPAHPEAGDRLRSALEAVPAPAEGLAPVAVDDDATTRAAAIVARMPSFRIGAVGERPDGFAPCDYTVEELVAIGSPTVERVELTSLFAAARRSGQGELEEVRAQVVASLDGVEDLDPDGVDTTLRLHLGLRSLIQQGAWSAVATRCWPECFTDMGGAACAGQAMLGDRGIPATCERDVFGAVTALVLGEAAGGPAFVADLVDLDSADDTVSLWHCGIAPLGMAHPEERPQATVHPNRGLPLLHQFRLRPGRVTVARISRSGGCVRLVMGGGEILDRPRPFSGTSAVMRPDSGADRWLQVVMGERLEHHFAIVHGDVRPVLTALATELGIEVVTL